MCVVIAQDQGTRTLTDQELDYGWDANPDGGGFAYINPDDGKIVVEKYMDKDEFKAAYVGACEKYADRSPFIIHMRIATHGGVSVDTAHPFIVDRPEGEMVFAHNGIINEMDVYTSDGVSDTMAFRDIVLGSLPAGWLDNDAIVELVGGYIGASKLVFLTTEPEASERMYIINASYGDEQEGIWFSNHSCHTPRIRKYVYPKAGSYAGWWAENSQHVGSGYTIAKSYLVRNSINDRILEEGYDQVAAEAEENDYCGDCLYNPCRCDKVCYYCNHGVGMCDCEHWITIEDMKNWVGDIDFRKERERDIQIFEEERNGNMIPWNDDNWVWAEEA